MKKKQIISMLLTAALCVSMLGACGSTKEETVASEEATEESTADEATSEESTNTATEETSEATEVLDMSAGLTEDGFLEGVDVTTLVTLAAYEGVTLPSDVTTVAEADLQTQIDTIMNSYATTTQVTDRAIVEGDSVNIDYVGSVDGVEFEGGNTNGNGTLVTAGSTEYIDDFLTQIIGHTPGETMDIHVTFPEDYGKDELNGKDALFVTTINYIEEDVVPELTDEFVVTNFGEKFHWNTVQDMKDGLTDDILHTQAYNHLEDFLMTNSVVSDVPEEALQFQRNSVIYNIQMNAARYGTDAETLVSLYGCSSVDDYLDAMAADIEASAQKHLIYEATAKDAGITVTDADIQDYFEALGYSDYSSIVDAYGIGYVKMAVMCQMVLDHMYDNAVEAE